MSRCDLYLENHANYCAARVELWPDEGLPEIHVFPFRDIMDFLAFEKWLDATIEMITGRRRVKLKRETEPTPRDGRRTTRDRGDDASPVVG